MCSISSAPGMLTASIKMAERREQEGTASATPSYPILVRIICPLLSSRPLEFDLSVTCQDCSVTPRPHCTARLPSAFWLPYRHTQSALHSAKSGKQQPIAAVFAICRQRVHQSSRRIVCQKRGFDCLGLLGSLRFPGSVWICGSLR